MKEMQTGTRRRRPIVMVQSIERRFIADKDGGDCVCGHSKENHDNITGECLDPDCYCSRYHDRYIGELTEDALQAALGVN